MRSAGPAPPGQAGDPRSPGDRPPRDERERTIRDVWAAILEIDEVGIHDNFFELGGHSLRATRAAYELQRVLGVHVDLIDLFKAPTIASLGERLVSRRPAGADAILPIPIPLPAHDEGLSLEDEGTAPLTAEERELLLGEDV